MHKMSFTIVGWGENVGPCQPHANPTTNIWHATLTRTITHTPCNGVRLHLLVHWGIADAHTQWTDCTRPTFSSAQQKNKKSTWHHTTCNTHRHTNTRIKKKNTEEKQNKRYTRGAHIVGKPFNSFLHNNQQLKCINCLHRNVINCCVVGCCCRNTMQQCSVATRLSIFAILLTQ